MTKKKILTLALAAIVAVTAIAGASFAYLTDTDKATNTFTIGNVKIEQYEKDRNGKDFVNGQKLLPIVGDYKEQGTEYHMGTNYIDKIVTVKNTGSEAAYIRTHIAIPAALDDGAYTYDALANVLHWNGASANDTFGAANPSGSLDNDWYWGKSTATDWPGTAGDWNCYQTTVNNVKYNVYVATHGTAVAAGKTTAPSLFGLYLDKDVDYNATTGKYFVVRNGQTKEFTLTADNTKVLVLSEAVQASGWNNAFTALDEAFGTVGSYNPWAE